MEEKHICDYGCGKEAIHKFSNGRWCCSLLAKNCGEIKRKAKEASKKYHKERKTERFKLVHTCKKCGEEFIGKYSKWSSGTFCSKFCANSKIQTEEMNEARRIKIKNLQNSGEYYRIYPPKRFITKNCVICGNEFEVRHFSKNATCGDKECYSKQLSNKLKGNSGGYRPNSGRSKSGYYKGIFCGSTYELAWVIFQMDHKISFTRYQGFIEYGESRKYYPDFWCNDEIIEIKGYWSDSVDKKTEAARNAGYKISVLYKKDLKEIFNYIKETYHVYELDVLYDDFKPKFKYTCDHCGKKFSTNHKRKSKSPCCSQICSGKNVNKNYVANR